jgi:hypothetical protein
MTAHDDHYRKIKSIGVEPIEAMETANCTGIPEQYHDQCRINANRIMMIKYTMRAGEKGDAMIDLQKAANHNFRAQNRRWPWEIDSSCVLDMGGE